MQSITFVGVRHGICNHLQTYKKEQMSLPSALNDCQKSAIRLKGIFTTVIDQVT